jgi:hypothetical protein
MAYVLDGYTLVLLPAPGGYSGYAPQRTRTEEKTLSAAVAYDWGVAEEDLVLVLEAPWVSRAEWLSLQGRYLAEDAYGVPKQYTFDDGDRDYEVEIVGLDGNPYHDYLNQNVTLTLRVLSVGA